MGSAVFYTKTFLANIMAYFIKVKKE